MNVGEGFEVFSDDFYDSVVGLCLELCLLNFGRHIWESARPDYPLGGVQSHQDCVQVFFRAIGQDLATVLQNRNPTMTVSSGCCPNELEAGFENGRDNSTREDALSSKITVVVVK